MGVIDAFVYAHNRHRRNMDNPGNFGDCMKGRVRCKTAITPAYAHAYQLICLTGHIPTALHSKFPLPAAIARYLYLPNARATARERGNDFQGWAIHTDGGTRSADGKTLAGWSAVARSHHGRIHVMFGPVVTTERPSCVLRCQDRTANNIAEKSAIIEALSFLGPHGLVARDACSCVFYDSKHAAGVCLGTIHARMHVQLGLSWQQLLLNVQRRQRFTMQHVHSHAENLGNECADHAAALGAFGLVSTFTFPHVGRVTHLILFRALIYATTLVMSWKSCVTLEQSMFLPPSTRPGVRALFHSLLRDVSLACITILLFVSRSFAWLNLLQFA